MTSTATDEPVFIPFIDMIAAQAARNPEGVAFREGDRTLSWRSLHEHTLQVAHALQLAGIGPGDKVAVLADRHVVEKAPVAELERSDHPWIKEYFLGPRGRAATKAA